jgi:hypothetical protein
MKFLGVQESTFVAFGGLFFWVLEPLYFGGHNFLSSIPFLMIFSVLYVPIERVQVFFGHQKQQNPPLGSCLPWMFKCLVIN